MALFFMPGQSGFTLTLGDQAKVAIMPIYEYQCAECGHRFEKIQKMSDEPMQDCPECGKPALKKLVSASSFKLKGGGWYETDFKGGSKSSGGSSSSSSSSGSSD